MNPFLVMALATDLTTQIHEILENLPAQAHKAPKICTTATTLKSNQRK